MKKKILGAALVSIMFVGCQNEEIQDGDQLEAGGKMVTLEVSQGAGSRTDLNGVQTLWSNGDQIYVTSADGMTNGVLTLKEGAGSPNGKFSGYVYGDGELKYSVYPVPESECVKTNVHRADKLDAPMRGLVSGKTVAFENLCTLIPIGSISGANEGKATISSPDYAIGATIKFGLKEGRLTVEKADDCNTIQLTNIRDGEEIYLPVFDEEKISGAVPTITLIVNINGVTEEFTDIPVEAGKISNVAIPDLWVEDGEVIEGTAMGTDEEPKAPVYNEANKEYEIYEAAELLWIAEQVNSEKDNFDGKTIKLYNDVNLNNVEWEPIGIISGKGFQGVFDGNSKTISNLKIDKPSSNYLGLFGVVQKNAKITNLTIKNVDIKGKGSVGALIGLGNYFKGANNINVVGNVKVTAEFTAGTIFGQMWGNINDIKVDVLDGSYVSTVSSPVGGVAAMFGENNHATNVASNIPVISKNITKSYTNSNHGVGGVFGSHNGSTSKLTNCSSSGNVVIENAENQELAERIGGVVGFIAGNKVQLIDCSFTGELSSSYNGVVIEEFFNNNLVGNCSWKLPAGN